MDSGIKIDIHGATASFFKEGWKQVASIDNNKESLELIKNYSWYNNNGYLYCSKLKEYLHRIVWRNKIGAEKLKKLTDQGFVIDHINNSEPYNCCMDNLHVLSSDINIAKGHTVDKDIQKVLRVVGIGLYFLGDDNYQISLGFNAPVKFYEEDGKGIDIVTAHINFSNFATCYNAIQIILTWAKGQGGFNIKHLQAVKFDYEKALKVVLTKEEAESGACWIKRDGIMYVPIRNDGSSKMILIQKPAKKQI